MRKNILTLLILLTPILIMAQEPICTNEKFYAIGSNSGGTQGLHSFTLSGNTITYDGLIESNVVAAHPSSLGVADLGSGNSFYSSDYQYLLRLNGTVWDTILSNTEIIFNSAGHGNYLYIQGSPNEPASNNIQRFDGTALSTIFSFTNEGLTAGLEDITVDNSGNVYFFTGAESSIIDHLRIISPLGATIGNIPIDFGDSQNGYGCFFLNNILYVGLGALNPTHPNTLIPIIITSATTASIGAAIAMPPVVIETPTGPKPLQLSDLASCGSADVPLPIGFTSLTAQKNKQGILVSWSVGNEANILKYVVQRSSNGIDFSDAYNTARNTDPSFKKNYEWLDFNSFFGDNFYRIKCVDYNNTFKYSQIVKVEETIKLATASIYPNPVIDKLIHLHLDNFADGSYEVRIVNKLGQVIATKSLILNGGRRDISFPVSNLSNDIYFLQISSAGAKVETLKFRIE